MKNISLICSLIILSCSISFANPPQSGLVPGNELNKYKSQLILMVKNSGSLGDSHADARYNPYCKSIRVVEDIIGQADTIERSGAGELFTISHTYHPTIRDTDEMDNQKTYRDVAYISVCKSDELVNSVCKVSVEYRSEEDVMDRGIIVKKFVPGLRNSRDFYCPYTVEFASPSA